MYPDEMKTVAGTSNCSSKGFAACRLSAYPSSKVTTTAFRGTLPPLSARTRCWSEIGRPCAEDLHVLGEGARRHGKPEGIGWEFGDAVVEEDDRPGE